MKLTGTLERIGERRRNDIVGDLCLVALPVANSQWFLPGSWLYDIANLEPDRHHHRIANQCDLRFGNTPDAISDSIQTAYQAPHLNVWVGLAHPILLFILETGTRALQKVHLI